MTGIVVELIKVLLTLDQEALEKAKNKLDTKKWFAHDDIVHLAYVIAIGKLPTPPSLFFALSSLFPS